MQLSSETISVLQNFATINPNIVLKPGQELKTISEAKNILAQADIVEDFPHDIGIYDLFEFLSLHSLIEAPSIQFESNAMNIHSTGGGCKLPNKQTVKYYSAEPSILTKPEKDITLTDDPVIEFNLSADVIQQIKKAASVLGHTDISIDGDVNGTSIKVFDPKDSSSNTFDFELGENPSGSTFSFVLNISNLKLMDGDYDVFVYSNGNMFISKWVNSNRPVRYYIALEQTSSFNV